VPPTCSAAPRRRDEAKQERRRATVSPTVGRSVLTMVCVLRGQVLYSTAMRASASFFLPANEILKKRYGFYK
jgi:hypothetical protein